MALEFPDEPPDRVRLTYLRARDPDTPTESTAERFLCDAVFAYDAPVPLLAVPSTDAVDIAVEFFAADGTLLAAGAASDVALDQPPPTETETERPPIDIRATHLDSFSCATASLSRARAFHSTLRLDTGQLLVIGGAVASPSGASDVVDLATGMYVTGSIELHDPVAGTFTELTAPDVVPRAMHESYVLASAEDEIVIAVVGGVTVSDPDESPALVADFDGLRLSPGDAAISPPVQILRFDPLANTITELGLGPLARPALASYSAVSEQEPQRPVLAAGGRTVMFNPMTMEDERVDVSDLLVIDPATGDSLDTLTMTTGRRGASVTRIDDDNAVIWGGHVDAPVADLALRIGDRVLGLGEDPLVAPLAVAAVGDTPTPRTLHQAVDLGGGELLIVGGFAIAGDGTATDPASPLLQRIDVDGLDVSSFDIDTVGVPSVPAGFSSVTRLGSGDFLITGGNPGRGYPGCSLDDPAVACSMATTYVYRTTTDTLEQDIGALLISRFGHRVTVLGAGPDDLESGNYDARYLVTGGLHLAPGGGLRVVADVESYDGRARDRDPGARDHAPERRSPGGWGQ